MQFLLTMILLFLGLALLALALSFVFGPRGADIWHVGNLAFLIFLGLFAGAVMLFNSLRWPRALYPHIDSIEELEAKGLLLKEDFQARRAFQIEEFEDEGSQYMIELQDGTVLFLVGQYLYEYEPIEGDPELDQPRQFPCTEFTVRRHKEKGYALDILCRGEVLEPECLVPTFDREDFKQGWIPEDGRIITDKSYDEIKQERLKRKSKRNVKQG